MIKDILTLMTPPFFEPEATPFSISGEVLSIPLGSGNEYMLSEMGELIRISACFGQYNLARLFPEVRGKYLLGDKIRTIRYGTMEDASNLTMHIRSHIASERAGSALAEIVDENDQLLYSFNHTFYILPAPFFETRFASFKKTANASAIALDSLPGIKVFDSEHNRTFTMEVTPFSYEHCLGHFPDYPLVAVAYLYKCILKGNIEWLNKHQMEILRVENIDITVSKAIPIDISCSVKVSIIQSSKNTYQFINEIFIKDDSHIPHCLLTIELLATS